MNIHETLVNLSIFSRLHAHIILPIARVSSGLDVPACDFWTRFNFWLHVTVELLVFVQELHGGSEFCAL